ncbi:MAG: VCBS repeat-containing protein [Anaerolineales bacterium]|nr:VCBS repeat-containing protein [Anaerolineales bacterium]
MHRPLCDAHTRPRHDDRKQCGADVRGQWSGVATGDLDGDGDLDLVLGNHDGDDAIFWNEGDLVFRKAPLSTGKTRDVKIVDVNADGRLDLILTRHRRAQLFRESGEGRFQRRVLPGVAAPAYVTNWAISTAMAISTW